MTKHCPKCKKEISEGDKFCNSCGKKIKEHKVSKDSKKNYLPIIIGSIVVVLALFIFAVPLPYSSTETYTEKEPYTATETYTEGQPSKMTHCDEEYYDFDVSEGNPDWYYLIDGKGRFEQKLYLQNNDDNYGCWLTTVALYMNDVVLKDSIANPSEVCVEPHQTKTLTSGYPLGFDEPIDYDSRLRVGLKILEAPTNSICYYEPVDVTKEKEVTKYKDVEKTRTITKYAPLIKQWFSR